MEPRRKQEPRDVLIQAGGCAEHEFTDVRLDDDEMSKSIDKPTFPRQHRTRRPRPPAGRSQEIRPLAHLRHACDAHEDYLLTAMDLSLIHACAGSDVRGYDLGEI